MNARAWAGASISGTIVTACAAAASSNPSQSAREYDSAAASPGKASDRSRNADTARLQSPSGGLISLSLRCSCSSLSLNVPISPMSRWIMAGVTKRRPTSSM
nr:hypothetical protein [Nonomuraea wenchangensis]